MKINGKITLLIGQEVTWIELIDEGSSTVFARVKLNPEQLSSALSRLAHTPCEIEVHGLDRIGKKMEYEDFVFEIPSRPFTEDEKKEFLEGVPAVIPEGWIADMSFNSQGSFFMRDDKQYARTMIRRWVEIPSA